MTTKDSRIEMLRRLLAANDVKLGTDDAAIQDLNDWFSSSVEADPGEAGQFLPIWNSVCHDVALFLGEVMIERHPNLRWEFFTWGGTDVAFQRHVIMGFSTEDPKLRTNIDIEDMVITYAYQLVARGGSIPDYGTVTVLGVSIDVDAIVAGHRGREIATDRFLVWLRMAARRA